MPKENGNDTKNYPKRTGFKATLFALTLILVAGFLAWLLAKPFLKTIALAAILAFLLDPVRGWLEKKLKGRRNITAVIIILIAGLVIVVPLALITWMFTVQAADFVDEITIFLKSGQFQDWMAKVKAGLIGHWLETRLEFIPVDWVNLEKNLPQHMQNLGQRILEYGGGFAGGIFIFISHFFMMMFMLFFLVRDGRFMLRGLRSLSPTSEEEEDNILSHVSGAAHAVVIGNLLTALCQGVVAGIGLTIAGLPGLVLGVITGIASMVPVVGTGIVTIPAIIWLAGTGQWGWAIFLTAWVILFVSPIDNYLRPFFMRGAGGQSTFFVFIAIIGGIAHFGVLGIIFGPMLLAVIVALVEIYRYEFVAQKSED